MQHQLCPATWQERDRCERLGDPSQVARLLLARPDKAQEKLCGRAARRPRSIPGDQKRRAAQSSSALCDTLYGETRELFFTNQTRKAITNGLASLVLPTAGAHVPGALAHRLGRVRTVRPVRAGRGRRVVQDDAGGRRDAQPHVGRTARFPRANGVRPWRRDQKGAAKCRYRDFRPGQSGE